MVEFKDGYITNLISIALNTDNVPEGSINLYSQWDDNENYLFPKSTDRGLIINGNVGFGTTTPTTLLTLNGDTGLSLEDNSRVKRTYYINAEGIKAPGAKPASFILHGLSGSWEFSNEIEANQQTISENVKIPYEADRSIAPILNIGIYANGVSPGVAKFQLEYLYVGENSDMTASAQETLTATATMSATSNGLTNISFTEIDLPSSTDQAIIWKLTRLSADAEDTISSSVFLKGISIEYIANKLGKAL